MRAFDLEDFIFGNTVCPAKFIICTNEESGEQIQAYNDEYLSWKKTYQLLVSWLMSTLSSSILGRVTQCVTSCEVWNTITTMFSQNSMARVMHLRSQLQTLKKGSMKVSEYIVKIKGITDSLMAAGQIISEQDLVAYILGGLGLEFDPVICNIASKKDEITLQDAQFFLMNYESRLEQYHSSATIDVIQASANLNTKSANFVREGGQFQNNNCGRSKGRIGGRGGRYYNQRLTCQLYGNARHFSAICYQRFDQSFAGSFGKSQSQQGQQSFSNNFSPVQGNFVQQQMEYSNGYSYPQQHMAAMITAPSIVADPNWYVDSGATNHITPDFNNLSINSEYKGKLCSKGPEGWYIPTHPSKG
ncbi:hypothetical protein ACOSQ3_031843 [Xanthoceras sorbifolium]